MTAVVTNVKIELKLVSKLLDLGSSICVITFRDSCAHDMIDIHELKNVLAERHTKHLGPQSAENFKLL